MITDGNHSIKIAAMIITLLFLLQGLACFDTGEVLLRFQGTSPQIVSTRADLVVGDAPLDEGVLINSDTTIDGDIIVMNNGSLLVQNCNLVVNGDIYVEDNGTIVTQNADLYMPSLWKGHRHIDVIHNGTFITLIGNYYFNQIVNMMMTHKANVTLAGLTVYGGMHFDLMDNCTLTTEASIMSTEFVINEGCVVNMNNTHFIMLWLTFAPYATANLKLGGDEWKTVDELRISNASADYDGIEFSLNVTNSTYVQFGLLVSPLTDLTIIDTELRAVGNIIWGVDQDLGGFYTDSYYLDFQPAFMDRVQHYVNSTVFTWNFYIFMANVSISDSIVGEVFAYFGTTVTLYDSVIDGTGGHTEVFANGTLICYDSTVQFLTMVHDDGHMEMHGGSLEDTVIIRDDATVHLIGTSRKKLTNLTLYDSGSCIALEILYPLNGTIASRLVDVLGTARLFKGPDYVGNFVWDLYWTNSTTGWTQITLGGGVEDDELAVWNTTGYDDDTYSLRLSMGGVELYHQVELRDVLPPGTHGFGVARDGLVRSYELHVPTGYDGTQALPLVFVLHGGYGNGTGMQYVTGYSDLADTEDFFVVYPNGTPEVGSFLQEHYFWDAGPYADTWVSGIDDVGFFGKMLDRFEWNINLDETSVFSTGLSRGGFMSFKLARDLPDRIAAVAPMGAVADPGNFTPTAPVPIMHIHGTDDRFNFYDGGESEAKPGHILLSVNETRDLWLANNLYDNHSWQVFQATGSVNTSVTATRYVSVSGAPYEVWTVYNGGHTWPGGKMKLYGVEYGPGDYVPGLLSNSTPMAMISSAFSATEETWNFFKDRDRWIPQDNRLPVIDSFTPITDPTENEADPGSATFTLGASDPDGHALHYAWTVDDMDQGIDSNTFTFDFNYTSAGTYVINGSVSDGYGSVPGHSWTLNITDVNRHPEITSFTPNITIFTVNEGDIIEFSVEAYDPDGDILSYIWKAEDKFVIGENSPSLTVVTTHEGNFSAGIHYMECAVFDGELEMVKNWEFTVLDVENIPPYVTDSFPADKAVNVSLDVEVRINFSEAMDATSVADSISIAPDTDWLSGFTEPDVLVIYFNEDLQYETNYTVTIGTLAADVVGNRMTTPFILTFTTELAPIVVDDDDVTDDDDTEKFNDTDEDGLPDEWEEQYFGNLSYGKEDDPDGDNYTNYDEYLRGSDPTVPDTVGDDDVVDDDDDDSGVPKALFVIGIVVFVILAIFIIAILVFMVKSRDKEGLKEAWEDTEEDEDEELEEVDEEDEREVSDDTSVLEDGDLQEKEVEE
jgi:polyhydroxybutyrate depolymerase